MVFVEILFPVLLLVAAGAVFSRLWKPSLEPLTQFALYLATPALVFEALVRHPVALSQLGRVSLLMVAYVTVLWLLAAAAARALRLPEDLGRAFALATVPMNVGNYGLPLVRFAFGPESEAFSVLVFVVFNIPLATWAIWLAAGGALASRESVRAFLRIPIFHATVLAFLVSASGLPVPAPLLDGLGLLGDAAIPVLLVILGMQLERTRVTETSLSLGTAVLLRLAVAPWVAWGLTGLLGFAGLERKVAILQTSTPTAVLTLLYALRFDCRPQWISSCIFVSTLVSAVSLSVVLWALL